ncbi:MAG: hypothetical protein ACI8P9_005389 [Parasphingorhabdus sp.]|jgi:hypothetical protein
MQRTEINEVKSVPLIVTVSTQGSNTTGIPLLGELMAENESSKYKKICSEYSGHSSPNRLRSRTIMFIDDNQDAFGKTTDNIKKGILVLWFAMIISFSASSNASAETLSSETSVSLQTMLRSYIYEKMDNGLYQFFDENTGVIKPYRLKKIHPTIFKKENRFMLCADFLDQNGNDVIIDYIFAPSTNGYKLEKEIAGRRSYFLEVFEKIF